MPARARPGSPGFAGSDVEVSPAGASAGAGGGALEPSAAGSGAPSAGAGAAGAGSGLGSLDTLKDGRDVWDNIQLIYKYPKGQKLTYSSISTNQFLPFFNGARPEMGEIIMGTEGTVEITVGFDEAPTIAWWYREPPKKGADVTKAGEKKPFVAGATMVAGGGANGPIPIMTSDLQFTGDESFFSREAKFARRWLTAKGIMVQQEQHNCVDTELESFFQNCRDGKKPKADLEIGLADSIAVILSNMAMDEGRKVYFNEIDKMGRGEAVKKS